MVLLLWPKVAGSGGRTYSEPHIVFGMSKAANVLTRRYPCTMIRNIYSGSNNGSPKNAMLNNDDFIE